jgi:CRISPR/Cas system-associated exonuclease Cas4 (RecB family)
MTSDFDEAVTSRKGAYHQSAIETILNGCSWSYYLNNILEIPTQPKPYSLVGTTFHSAVELHEVARMNNQTLPTLEELRTFCTEEINKQKDLVDKNMMMDKAGEPLDLVSMCLSALDNWYSAPTKNEGISLRDWLLQFKPVAIEPYFRVQLVENADPIAGWIDGVYQREDGTFFIVDQKTAGDFSRWGYEGEGHRYQATMYAVALLLSEEFPEIKELDLEMHYLISRTKSKGNIEKARRVVVKPELDDVSLLGTRIKQVETIIKENLFTPKTDSPLCSPRFCSFYEKCQVTLELGYKGESNE